MQFKHLDELFPDKPHTARYCSWCACVMLTLPPTQPSTPTCTPPIHLSTRSSSEVQKRKNDALTALLRYPPEVFVELVGVDRFKDGTSILFEALQCSEVNKQASGLAVWDCCAISCIIYLQLLFSLFDVIVLELFPELADDDVH